MLITRKVLIKQVLTDESKKKLIERFQKHKTQLEQEYQQLDLFERRLIKKYPGRTKEVQKKYLAERQIRQEELAEKEWKIEQVQKLPIGVEIIEKEVEALVEVEVGMNSKCLTDPIVILIKDGIVKRIDD